MANQIYKPSTKFSEGAYIQTMDAYHELYDASIANPTAFWDSIASKFYWQSPATPTVDPTWNFDVRQGPIQVSWFQGRRTNICYNLVDRHVEAGLGSRIAYIFEGNEPGQMRTVTYAALYQQVCKVANALKALGVRRHDRVCIYMPSSLELVYAMLACARIGAVHSVVFAGFSSDALADRIIDADCRVLLTANGTYRGQKFIPLKQMSSKAIEICKQRGFLLRKCVTFDHIAATEGPERSVEINSEISWDSAVDVWWEELLQGQSPFCEPELMSAEDPLFILYTSGSTGKPKGIVHSIGGYMIYTATVFKYVFDYHLDDVFFCTADLGWITGHTFNVYGSLANCATVVLFDGVPMHPTPSRFWETVARHRVTIFYTAPTAIRSLMKFDDAYVNSCDLSSLRLLGSVGEPLNPEAWLWYYNVVGKGNCPIADTYWQTETGAPIITPMPGCTPLKPGSATLPFFGIVPALLSDDGEEIKGVGEGHLVLKQAWPGMMRTVLGDHKRFESTYFERFPGYYVTGDGAYRDANGYLTITGRIDDLLNVSGHLLSTAEVERALNQNEAVSESAAVSAPHPIKGECLHCFVCLKQGFDQIDDKLDRKLKQTVRDRIGAFAQPERIYMVYNLPKTRSGKILRRVLRKFVRNETDLGDLSTLSDPSVIRDLYSARA